MINDEIDCEIREKKRVALHNHRFDESLHNYKVCCELTVEFKKNIPIAKRFLDEKLHVRSIVTHHW